MSYYSFSNFLCPDKLPIKTPTNTSNVIPAHTSAHYSPKLKYDYQKV